MDRRPPHERPDWYDPKQFRGRRNTPPDQYDEAPRPRLLTLILYCLAIYGALALWRDFGHHFQ